jgi:predicted nucleotidyltransferase
MERQLAIELLNRSTIKVQAWFGVIHLALFGSTVCYATKHESDIDVLVAFYGRASSERYFDAPFTRRLARLANQPRHRQGLRSEKRFNIREEKSRS